MAHPGKIEVEVRVVSEQDLKEIRRQAKRVERSASTLARQVGQLETLLELHGVDGIELVVRDESQ